MPKNFLFAPTLAAGVLIVGLIGCSSTMDLPGQLPIGDYALTSINDATLPATLTDGSTVTRGMLHISSGGVVMEQTLAPRSGSGGSFQVTQVGNYAITQNGSEILLRSLEYDVTDTGYVQGTAISIRHHLDATTTGAVQLNQYLR